MVKLNFARKKFLALVFILGMIHSPYLWGESGPTLAKVSFASENLRKLKKVGTIWDQIASFKDYQLNAKRIPKWQEYSELSSAQQNAIRQSNPEVGSLCQLLGTDELLQRADDARKTLAAEALFLRSNPKTLREFMQAYHESELFVADDFFDDALALDYDNAERAINAKSYKRNIYAAEFGVNESQTSYKLIREIFRLRPPQPNEVFYDLGSGHGRLLLYGALLYPQVKFIGVELVSERTKPARETALRLGLNNLQQKTEDVMKTNFNDGISFYMFNPFFDLMPKVLSRFKTLARKRKIFIISLQITTMELEREPWLALRSAKEFYKPALFESR